MCQKPAAKNTFARKQKRVQTMSGSDKNWSFGSSKLTSVCCISNVLPITSADEELDLGKQSLKVGDVWHGELHKPGGKSGTGWQTSGDLDARLTSQTRDVSSQIKH